MYNIIKIQHGSRSYCPDALLGMNALRPWPYRYDLELRSWHTLEPWKTSVRNIIQIKPGSEELSPRHGFWLCVPSDLGDLTLSQCHDTPLIDGKQLCKIFFKSNLAVGSDFGYVCTVTLTLEIWPWDMDNNFVKYYPDQTREQKVMAKTPCEQTGWFLYTPKLCLRGYNDMCKICIWSSALLSLTAH